MRIAYLILNYKSFQDTINVTNKILSFINKDDIVLIVDNLSPNESFEEISKCYQGNKQVHVIQSCSNGGYAKGNNVGLNYLKIYEPKYVCVINNDVYFTEECIESMVTAYSTLNDAGAISPVQHDIDDNISKLQQLKCYSFWDDILSYFRVKPKFHKFESNTSNVNIQKVGFVPGSFVFIDYKLFSEIGFFYDKTFLFMEETFLSKRLETVGKSCYIVLNSSYIHAHSKTINSEASRTQQKKMLLDSRILYTKEYRSYSKIKIILLKLAFNINLMLGKIKRFISRH